MTDRETAGYALAALLNEGAEKAQAVLVKTRKYELNVEAGELSLLRTTHNSSLHYTALRDLRRGRVSRNKTDRQDIDEAAGSAIEIMNASEQDPAYALAERQEPEVFESGPREPDLDGMYDRLKEFVGAVKAGYPSTILEQGILDFTFRNSLFLNSNGVDFETNHGAYNCGAMFTTREGRKTSSFNYSGFSTKDLEKEIIESGSLRTLLAQSSEQTDLRAIGGKFTGEVIVTPDCLADFVGYFTGTFLSDQALISGTSILKDKLGGQVAHENLTLHSRPRSRELAENYFVTGDGYRAEDSTIVDRGVLKTFLLSLYGARKTGRDRAVNNGGAFIVEPGERSFEEITGSVKRGLLLCRFSGGSPADNGDFSGVAKNSYSIENGKILHPVSETMISGNLLSFFKSIRAVSRERINFGSAIYPWVCVSDLTISGK